MTSTTTLLASPGHIDASPHSEGWCGGGVEDDDEDEEGGSACLALPRYPSKSRSSTSPFPLRAPVPFLIQNTLSKNLASTSCRPMRSQGVGLGLGLGFETLGLGLWVRVKG